jgi:hypothetical protein
VFLIDFPPIVSNGENGGRAAALRVGEVRFKVFEGLFLISIILN